MRFPRELGLCLPNDASYTAGRQTAYGIELRDPFALPMRQQNVAVPGKITIRFWVLSYVTQILTFVGFYYHFVTCAFIARCWQTSSGMYLAYAAYTWYVIILASSVCPTFVYWRKPEPNTFGNKQRCFVKLRRLTQTAIVGVVVLVYQLDLRAHDLLLE